MSLMVKDSSGSAEEDGSKEKEGSHFILDMKDLFRSQGKVIELGTSVRVPGTIVLQHVW